MFCTLQHILFLTLRNVTEENVFRPGFVDFRIMNSWDLLYFFFGIFSHEVLPCWHLNILEYFGFYSYLFGHFWFKNTVLSFVPCDYLCNALRILSNLMLNTLFSLIYVQLMSSGSTNVEWIDWFCLETTHIFETNECLEETSFVGKTLGN